MDYLIIKICIICAVSSWAWVNLLTVSRGLFDWVPQYYPNKLRPKPLECSHCLSGWTSFIFTAIQLPYWFYDSEKYFYSWNNVQIYYYILFSPFLGMVLNHLITKR